MLSKKNNVEILHSTLLNLIILALLSLFVLFFSLSVDAGVSNSRQHPRREKMTKQLDRQRQLTLLCFYITVQDDVKMLQWTERAII